MDFCDIGLWVGRSHHVTKILTCTLFPNYAKLMTKIEDTVREREFYSFHESVQYFGCAREVLSLCW